MKYRNHALALGLTLGVATVTGLAAQGGPLGTPIPAKPLGAPVEGEPVATPVSFAARQLAFARVAEARDSAEAALQVAFVDRGLGYPAREIFLRVFKHERQMELWARSHPDAPFTLVKTYPVCALPGQLGPKSRIGDLQVPEGFYYIDQFNPRSDFHLSLRVNYPNTADRLRRSALALGGDIYIHGGCATVGCVPIEDRNIREVYWLAVQATEAGQRLIPVHIFPARLEEPTLRWLADTFHPEPDLLDFWNNLAQGYAFFENTRRVPWITVDQNGLYRVPAMPAVADAEPAGAQPAAGGPAVAAPAIAAGDSVGGGGRRP